MTFGEHFKACRLRTGKGLHAFCQEHGFTPTYVMDLERGRVTPSIFDAMFMEYASALGIEPRTAEWGEFQRLASDPATLANTND